MNTARDSGEVYFDAVATLIFLLLVGRYLQYRAQRAAADAATLLGALSPATARLVEGDTVRDIPTEAVTPGMTLEVRAGDTLGADGSVTSGASALDLALLTGESRLVQVVEGDAVFAGTVNLSSPFRMLVAEAGETSRLGRLLRDVEEGARGRPPIVLLADRVAGYFVAVVLMLAAGTLAFWWPRDAAAAVDHAIALLVVTCPCALAMATPLAFTAAIGRAARRGILVKGGHALETLARPGTLFLDKTGTLTSGRLTLEAWTGDDATRGMVAALERKSRHPVALALANAWPDAQTFTASEVVEVLGAGIEGRVNCATVIVGKPSWVATKIGARLVAPEDDPRTRVAVAVNGHLVASAVFGDPVRPEARAVVQEIVRRGWDVRIVSGDAPEVVAAVAARLGLDPARSLGGVTPEQKRDIVRAALPAATLAAPVVMVGDGVNDAAAISTATAGIAVRGGAEAAMAAADVYLGCAGIGALPELLEGARRTTRLVRRLSLVALAYNAVGVALAVTGTITPLLAAILMPVSSVSVVLGAWQGKTFPRKAA
jgi:Cu2+-exporting ATPase